MSEFICPVCKLPLMLSEKTYKCKNNHSFDLSKSGYVNLLMSQQSSVKRHGDDKLMVKARRDFLDKGYYSRFSDELCRLAAKYYSGGTVLDAGCGEGYYTDNLYRHLKSNGRYADFLAVDISKSALDLFAKRNSEIKRSVASVYNLPVADGSCSMITNIFAPIAIGEFSRALCDGGFLITAIALKNHLWELKCAVYDKPRKNETDDLSLDGFSLIEMQEIKQEIEISSNEDIISLFQMTPYYYKTSKSDYEKLLGLCELTTQLEFGILIYKKD